MIKDIVLVGIGSGIGGICRYLISLLIGQTYGGFPWGTFSVNIVGCLLQSVRHFASILCEIDDLDLLYTVDLLDYQKKKGTPIGDHIDRVGQVFYAVA